MKATAPKMTLTREERAVQIWQVLLARAANEQTITYKALAAAIDDDMLPKFLAKPLDCIYYYCEQQRLPRLTVLVVRTGAGRPAGDDWGDVDKARQKVFAEKWFRRRPPTTQEFSEALRYVDAS